jgi:HEAT repeat protein
MAESAVLGYRFVPDTDTRARASQLLADYGTKASTVAAAVLKRLKSNQTEVQFSAAVWCAENPPADETSKAEVARLLAKMLDDLSPKVGSQALRALKLWATRDCLAPLVDFARRQQKAAFTSPDLIDVLVQFPDEAAAEAIALQLPNPALRGRAVQGLLKLGAVATKAVLPYLNDPDSGVQKEAQDLCRLLKFPAERQLEQILADVAGADIARGRAALQTLAQLRPDEASRAMVAEALNAALLDANEGIREDALNAVKVWGSPENTSTLLTMLGDYQTGGSGRNPRVIEALGSLRDPRAAQQLAQGLTHVRERCEVSIALKAIGRGAEEAVVPFLQSPDPGARITACQILGEIGTDKSLQPLQIAAQLYNLDGGFNQEMRVATGKILARN